MLWAAFTKAYALGDRLVIGRVSDASKGRNEIYDSAVLVVLLP